jgi:hypothetical protein
VLGAEGVYRDDALGVRQAERDVWGVHAHDQEITHVHTDRCHERLVERKPAGMA